METSTVSTDTATTIEVMKCSCGAKLCWVQEEKDLVEEYGECNGRYHVSEVSPGEYSHFCDKHDTGD